MLQSKKYYAGIGSRESPKELIPFIQQVVERLNNLGYILRSGGAEGADSYFEQFAKEKEIYLPWKGFNGNSSKLYSICEMAYRIAQKYHPSWYYLSQGAKKCIARNSYQILGKDLKTPSEFVICWTPKGKEIGGTAQAMKISRDYKIPVYNMFNQQKEILEFLDRLEQADDR